MPRTDQSLLRPKRETKRWARNSRTARYLGVSDMTLWRWKRDADLKFPTATVINNVDYNDLDAIDDWMRSQAVRRLEKQS
jgi:predicted DNA-binding transcriptional regulator AlpA